MEMKIQYATRADGLKTAYGTMGAGPPLLVPPPWVWSVEWWQMEPNKSFAERLAEHHTVVSYDKHGCGLSDRNRIDFSIEDDMLDIQAVVEAAGLKRFAAFGISGGARIAIVYAHRHPGRVTRLAFFGAGPGPTADRSPQEQAVFDALLGLVRAHWGLGSKATTEAFFGELGAEAMAQVDEAQRNAATADMAASLLESGVFGRIDARPLLSSLTMPTLVLHRRDDKVVPFDRGRELATLLPNARLVPLDGSAHVPTYGDAESVLQPLLEFLGTSDGGSPSAESIGGGTRTVLFTDLVGHTEMMQRLGDDKGRGVLREHERITRETLKQYSGDEVKTMGDGFMASFGSVTKAMDCAIALQRAFAAHTESTPEPLHVRVGLNAGEPIEEDGDLFGSTVILASRIAAQAGAGEILIPEPLRHLLSGKSYVYADRGETALKGFEDAVRLYEVRWRSGD